MIDELSLNRRQKMPRSPSNTPNDVAEKREKRVLIQMSVLVLVFLICWLPFWSTFAALHICHYLWPEDIQVIIICRSERSEYYISHRLLNT